MSDYTPMTEEVRLEYMAVRWGKSDTASFDARAEFDRWLAEVRAEAWDECCDEVSMQGTVQLPDNPYRGGSDE